MPFAPKVEPVVYRDAIDVHQYHEIHKMISMSRLDVYSFSGTMTPTVLARYVEERQERGLENSQRYIYPSPALALPLLSSPLFFLSFAPVTPSLGCDIHTHAHAQAN